MRRRDVLLRGLAAAAAAALPVRARAWPMDPVEPSSVVGACHLDVGSNPRPRGFSDLLEEVGRLTSVPVRTEVPARAPDDAGLHREPLLVLVGREAFDPLPDAAIENLRGHLQQGGFLFVDDASGLDRSPFYTSVERLVGRLFPDRVLEPLGSGHAVYRSFFLVEGAQGRFVVRPYLEGVTVGDITPVIVSRNDMCGAFSRLPPAGWAWEVVPGGEPQRTRAFELGVNVVLYALTANYKLDAVHVDALLRRMRDEGRIP